MDEEKMKIIIVEFLMWHDVIWMTDPGPAPYNFSPHPYAPRASQTATTRSWRTKQSPDYGALRCTNTAIVSWATSKLQRFENLAPNVSQLKPAFAQKQLGFALLNVRSEIPLLWAHNPPLKCCICENEAAGNCGLPTCPPRSATDRWCSTWGQDAVFVFRAWSWGNRHRSTWRHSQRWKDENCSTVTWMKRWKDEKMKKHGCVT